MTTMLAPAALHAAEFLHQASQTVDAGADLRLRGAGAGDAREPIHGDASSSMRRRPLTSRDPRTEAWLRKNAVACLALAILACGDGSTNPADGPALRILAGANLTDTIGAAPLQGLVVQVLDSDGRPEPGVEVQFESAPDVTPAPPLVYVGAVGDRWMLRTVSDTTDGKGRATVRVRLGDQVGPASIVIRVP